MGLDVGVYLVPNRNFMNQEGAWSKIKSGWVKDEDDCIDFTQPSEVCYWRKFWDMYKLMAPRYGIDNEKTIYGGPLTKQDIEDMIHLATHTRDYFGSFDSVPQLCEVLDHYDEATDNGMVFMFGGNY